MKPFSHLVSRFIMLAGLMSVAVGVQAASPSGNDWFQVLANPYTGGDNTGDGGTGLPASLNYYYVGQSFVGTMQINVSTPAGSSAANIWLEYPTTTISATGLTTGSYFPTWSGQVVSSTIGRIYSTGFRTSGYTTGQGSFGTVTFTMLKPTAASYGVGSPAVLDINIGTVGLTTESNISNDGVDLLDDAEDFRLHVWADTVKPYALNPSPANAAAAVSIDSDYGFDLRDSKNGEGDNTGVGTGVNTTEPPGSITTDDGGGAVSMVAYDAFSCSGVWGTNLCGVTVNPPPPSGISGDTRNWKYSTTYTVIVSGFKDLASASQDQFGDANGPNTMDPKTYTFTTEADTIAPRVTAETPARSSGGNSPATNIVVDIQDRKTYPAGPSGTGVAPATCKFNVSSPSVTLTTYQQGSPTVTVTTIDYGYRYTINPGTDFAQNEVVSVSAYDCTDLVGNMMTTDNWTFSTADSAAPYVTNESPSNDQTAALNQNVTFHIKDDGTGVNLAQTVIYLNGNYYTNGGGAGQVTVNGTRITYATSSNFNGSNYVGDTTARSGTVNDEIFTLDPQFDFAAGEAVPVIIYSRDASGNIMERVVYAFNGTGISDSCPAASSFCGTGTTFNGTLCVATDSGGSGGGSCSSNSTGGGMPSTYLEINEPTVYISQVNETSILITWATNLQSSSMVVYDTHPSQGGTIPRYDYRLATPEVFATSTYHSVQVYGLVPGTIYYFRPTSRSGEMIASGLERFMLPRVTTQEISHEIYVKGEHATTTIVVPSNCPVPAALVPLVSSGSTSTDRGGDSDEDDSHGSRVEVSQTLYSPVSYVQWTKLVRNTLPPVVGYILMGFACLLALSILGLLRMRSPHYVVIITVLMALVLGLVVLSSWILERPLEESGVVRVTLGKQIDVRGGVVALFDSPSVTGIDLTVGDTSIRTTTGGQFAFPNAHVGEDVRMNHPLLKRAVYWRLTDQVGPLALPFDVSLFNAIPESEIIIVGFKLDQQAQIAHVNVLSENQTKTYSFAFKDGAWSLVE
ncbi:MAG: hypothetical protein WCK01_04825 [Candidatus Uhrbacteria bacterium]